MSAYGSVRSAFVSLLVFGLALAPLHAQRVKFENLAEGYRLMVGKAVKAVPTEPNERQVLAKWGGTIEFKDKLFRGDSTCTVSLVRIRKGVGATTGEKPKPDDGEPEEGGRTVREASIESLNSGTSVELFLKKRGYKSDLQPVQDEKPIHSKDGSEYSARQILGASYDERKFESREVPTIRCYLLEDASEYFGLLAVGPFCGPFRELVEDMAQSLERIARGASELAGSAVDLGNQDFRQQVRSKLVKGWAAYDTPHFIFVTNTKNRTLIDQILVDVELMRDAYIARFPPIAGLDLEKVISSVRFCQTYKDYMAYGGPPGTGGYWNFRDEELVLVDVQTLDPAVLKANPNLKNIQVLDVLYHEAMHQYFFYCNGNLAPASWFNEGFGEVFGGAVPNRAKQTVDRIDRNKFRLFWIKQSQRQERWPDLNAFLKMSQREFYGPSSLQNYAFAWSFCYFLEEQRKDPKGNKEWALIPDRYLANLRAAAAKKSAELHADPKDKKWLTLYEDELQDQAYTATFTGINLPALEQAWIETIKKWR